MLTPATTTVGRPCGTRAAFAHGCRCERCVSAQRARQRAAYRRSAQRLGIGRADPEQVRRHLNRLDEAGMGARSVAAAAGLDRKTVQDIARGRRPCPTLRTALRILRVNADHAADHCLIDAAPTWALIEELREEGYTLRRLAELLGYAGKTVPIGRDRCSVRNAARVRALHEALTGDAARPIPQTRPFYSANRVYAQHRSHA